MLFLDTVTKFAVCLLFCSSALLVVCIYFGFVEHVFGCNKYTNIHLQRIRECIQRVWRSASYWKKHVERVATGDSTHIHNNQLQLFFVRQFSWKLRSFLENRRNYQMKQFFFASTKWKNDDRMVNVISFKWKHNNCHASHAGNTENMQKQTLVSIGSIIFQL